MKAGSIGLEVWIKINQEELKQLETNGLRGRLKFYEPRDSESRLIDFEIKYDPDQKEFIGIAQEPEGYFGDADKINFSINRHFYESLIENSEFVERFPYCSAGKLNIKVDNFISSGSF